MKEKLLKVINGCTTLKQLLSASNYLTLYATHKGLDGIYYDGLVALRDRLQSITGAITRNMLDYKAYAGLILSEGGDISEANAFLGFAELELHKLEELIKEVQNG